MKGAVEMRSVLRGGLVGLIIVLVAYAIVIRRWLLEWGSTESERAKALPGDEVVPNPKYEVTHAVTINAPATEVWKWLVQIGQGRGGFYTYDQLENLMRLEMHSADRIDPKLQSLTHGDIVSLAPDNNMPMWVVTLEPDAALVLSTSAPDSPPVPGDYLKGGMAGSWAFILEPLDSATTRFIVRFRSDWTESVPASLLNMVMLEPAHCIMERGMMLGIKERAEGNREESEIVESASAA
jgi:uncharacterized protein YndB with AHSA1/START domain